MPPADDFQSVPPDASRSEPLPSGTSLGDYRIDGVLGQGGFGVTYLATDSQLEEQVAIKEFFPAALVTREGDQVELHVKDSASQTTFSSGLDAFIEEARIIAQFRHPNVVQVRRFFRQNGTAYIVFSLERGRSLERRISDGPSPSQSELYALIFGLLDGLEALHSRKVLHRDIKPSNIIIREDGVPVLIDFGAASKQFTIGGAFASAGYSPPEQYDANGKQGPWTDYYALGATLYQCIAGTPPPDAVARTEKEKIVPAEHVAAGKYDLAILRTVDWLLALDWQGRPQSAKEIRAALISANPGSSGELAPTSIVELVTQRIRPEEQQGGSGRFSGGRVRVAAVLMATTLLSAASYGYWQWVSHAEVPGNQSQPGLDAVAGPETSQENAESGSAAAEPQAIEIPPEFVTEADISEPGGAEPIDDAAVTANEISQADFDQADSDQANGPQDEALDTESPPAPQDSPDEIETPIELADAEEPDPSLEQESDSAEQAPPSSQQNNASADSEEAPAEATEVTEEIQAPVELADAEEPDPSSEQESDPAGQAPPSSQQNNASADSEEAPGEATEVTEEIQTPVEVADAEEPDPSSEQESDPAEQAPPQQDDPSSSEAPQDSPDEIDTPVELTDAEETEESETPTAVTGAEEPNGLEQEPDPAGQAPPAAEPSTESDVATTGQEPEQPPSPSDATPPEQTAARQPELQQPPTEVQPDQTLPDPIELAAREQASSCIAAAADPCDVRDCVAPYQREFGASADMQRLLERTEQLCRENAAVVYSGTRGFYEPSPPNCLASYQLEDIRIERGRITFRSEQREWSGTIDQDTGELRISTGDVSPRPLFAVDIEGNAMSEEGATMLHQLCGAGFLRLRRP